MITGLRYARIVELLYPFPRRMRRRRRHSLLAAFLTGYVRGTRLPVAVPDLADPKQARRSDQRCDEREPGRGVERGVQPFAERFGRRVALRVCVCRANVNGGRAESGRQTGSKET